MSNETEFNPKDYGIDKFGTITMLENGDILIEDFDLVSASDAKDQNPRVVIATILSDFFQAFAEHVKSQEES